MCVCEFSDGKGGKEENRWAPEWGGTWHPERLGNRPSGPQLAREQRSQFGQESALNVNIPA